MRRTNPFLTIPSSLFILLAALITLLGFYIRIFDIRAMPPGLHLDEAANGLLVNGIAYDSYRPVFIRAYTGKEVLWFYAAAAVMRLTGCGVFPLRLTSILFGTLTIPITGWLARQLYRQDARRDWLALLSMLIIAVLFWHGVLSRLADRAITQPVLQALAIGFLWLALQSQQRPVTKWPAYAAVAGGFLGLAGYTYLAVRIFPLALGVPLAILFVCDPRRLERLKVYGLFVGCALLTVAPMLWFFWNNPEMFFTRIDQVAPTSLAEAMAGWRQALGMYFIRGDLQIRFNIPERPIFDPVLGIAFLIGVGVAAIDAFQTRDPLEKARGSLLITWPVIMLAPTALATSGYVPNHLRAAGLAPLIAFYPALGLLATARGLGRIEQIEERLKRSFPAIVCIVLAGIGGFFAVRDTIRWGRTRQALYYSNHTAIVSMVSYINAPEQQDLPTYITTEHQEHPTVDYLSARSMADYSIGGGDVMVIAPETETLMVYSYGAMPPDDWLYRLRHLLVAEPYGPGRQPDFRAYRVPPDFRLDTIPGRPQNFANLVVLESWAVRNAGSGTSVELDLGWRVIGVADQADYVFTGELCDRWGWCWLAPTLSGELERGVVAAYPSFRWKPGERILTRMEIPLPEGIPPTSGYTARISVYSATRGSALPVIDEAGDFAGRYAEISRIDVQPNLTPYTADLPVQHRAGKRMQPGIDLFGYDLPNLRLRQGETLRLALYWQTRTGHAVSYPVKLALGDGTALYDGPPVKGTYPTTAWRAGEIITDRYVLRIPSDLPPGAYALLAQLGESTPVALGTINIEVANRTYDIPPNAWLLERPVRFGEEIELVGFLQVSRRPTGDGTVTVQPIWKARQDVLTGYTVFVHIIDEAGSLVAQSDRAPQRAGQVYPSDLWVENEVVIDDPFTVMLPANIASEKYRIKIGLYLPENGQRLAVVGSADNSYILPAEVEVP